MQQPPKTTWATRGREGLHEKCGATDAHTSKVKWSMWRPCELSAQLYRCAQIEEAAELVGDYLSNSAEFESTFDTEEAHLEVTKELARTEDVLADAKAALDPLFIQEAEYAAKCVEKDLLPMMERLAGAHATVVAKEALRQQKVGDGDDCDEADVVIAEAEVDIAMETTRSTTSADLLFPSEEVEEEILLPSGPIGCEAATEPMFGYCFEDKETADRFIRRCGCDAVVITISSCDALV